MATEKQHPQQTLNALGQAILADWQARYGAMAAALPRPEAALAGIMPTYRQAWGDLIRIQAGWMDGIAAVSALCDPQLPWHWLDGGGMDVSEAATVGIPAFQGKRNTGPEPILTPHSPTPPRPFKVQGNPAALPKGMEWPLSTYPPGTAPTAFGHLDAHTINQETQNGLQGTSSGLAGTKNVQQTSDAEEIDSQKSNVSGAQNPPRPWAFERVATNALEQEEDRVYAPMLETTGPEAQIQVAQPLAPGIQDTQAVERPSVLPPVPPVASAQGISFRGLADFAASAQHLVPASESTALTSHTPPPATEEHRTSVLPAAQPVAEAAPLTPANPATAPFLGQPRQEHKAHMRPASSLDLPDWESLQRVPRVLSGLHATPHERQKPRFPAKRASQGHVLTPNSVTAHTHNALTQAPASGGDATGHETPVRLAQAPAQQQAQHTALEPMPAFPHDRPLAQALTRPVAPEPVPGVLPAPEFLVEDMLDQLAAQLQRDFQRIYGR